MGHDQSGVLHSDELALAADQEISSVEGLPRYEEPIDDGEEPAFMDQKTFRE